MGVHHIVGQTQMQDARATCTSRSLLIQPMFFTGNTGANSWIRITWNLDLGPLYSGALQLDHYLHSSIRMTCAGIFSSMMVFGSLWLHQNGSCGRPFLYYSLLEWSSNFRPGIRKIFPSQIEFVCGGSFFHCSGLWPPLLVKLVLHNLRPLTRAHDMSCWCLLGFRV
jgi:hypothetical protein